ncbi:MAG: gliding motility-associated C-terminal domain-containing protein [Bacteroidota bacterium]
MENRLPKYALFFLLTVFFSFSTILTAQDFQINFSGEDTIYVGSDCNAVLDWGHPNTVSFTSLRGTAIDTFYVANISGNFAIGDTIRARRFIDIDYYVEDVNGINETLSRVLTILIADSTKPVLDLATLPRDTTYDDLNDVPLPPSISTITGSDNCEVELVFYAGESDRPPNCGSFTRRWVARDVSGNESDYIQTISIRGDTTAPTWTSDPTSLTISCDAVVEVDTAITNWLATNGNGVTSDPSGVTITNDFSGFSGCSGTGTTTVTFTATDDCGNASTRSASLTVTDTIAPTIDQVANDLNVSPVNPAVTLEDWLRVHGNATAFDFCTVIDNSDTSTHWTIPNIDTTTSCGGNVSYVATFKVTDACGNADSTIATYSVVDGLGSNIAGQIPDTTDACGGDNDGLKLEQWFIAIRDRDLRDKAGNQLTFVEINYVDRDSFVGNWMGVGVPLPDFIPDHDCQWFLDAEIIFEDDCDDLVRDTARFSLTDTIRPTIDNIPADTVVDCGQIPAPIIVTASDNCDTSVTVTLMEKSDTTLSAINVTRTWTAMDDCGNSAVDSQLIMVIDTIAPMMGEVPSDTIVTCGNIPDAPLFIQATDNCTDSFDLTYGFDEISTQLDHPDSCLTYSYRITRIWTVTDAFNNTDSSIQIITVVDTLAPTFTVPNDITVSCELQNELTITGQPTDLMDNCDTMPNFSFVDLVIGSDCSNGGALDTIVRTWTVRDACGNATQDTQRIILIDTTAPVLTGLVTDITIQCNGDGAPLPVIGTDITATDNCMGNPLIQYLGETNTQGNDPLVCDFYNYAITRTWRATDACGNTDEFTQNITIVDTLAPTIICPDDLTLESSADSCGGTYALPQPLFFDDCTGVTGTDTLRLTQNFTNASGGDINETPVDTLVFDFNIGGNAPNKTIASDVTLTINLNGVDGEGANEIFSIIGEDQTVFAGTNPSPTQCGNSVTTITLSAAQANEYAKDSVITFRLGANGTGTEAINNICPNGNAELVLSYSFESPSASIELSYKIDGGARTNLAANSTANLETGVYQLMYFARDCSGNQDSCTFQITVEDKTAPTFDCPTAISTISDSNSCTAAVTLPFPTNFADNCGAFNNYNQRKTQMLTFRTDANAGQVPNVWEDTFTVSNPNAIADGQLIISFVGDNADAGEFFNIFGENNTLLGTTNLGDSTSECASAVITTLALPKDSINLWAADGQLVIRAIPNLDAGNFTDFVNPCDTSTTAAGTDGKSMLGITVDFPTVEVNYTIADTSDFILKTGVLPSPTSTVTEDFAIGVSRVTYTITDAANNSASCLFTVEVRDTIAPEIICNSGFQIPTNPAGDSISLSLFIDSLTTSINENCGIDSIIITPNQVSCADLGMVTISITVRDSSGNEATCQTDIEVITESLEPTFSVGVCNDDALFLFADTTFVTPISTNANFTYSWSGPNNFTSAEANPTIPNVGPENSGNYTLTMTSATGCSATGEVLVNISRADVPPISTMDANVCTSDEIRLTTSAVNCDSLEYQWYEIVSRDTIRGDTVILLGTSTIPSFTINNPTAGAHAYYLIVQCADCSSLGSEILTVNAFETPVAMTGAEIINICEGETIALSSPMTDQSFTYKWVGPGFTSDLPTPAPIADASGASEGVYSLTVSKNGCTSEEAFTIVNVTNRPTQPSIANESGAILCEGSQLILKTDVSNANTYTWTNKTTFATVTTTVPELRIDTSAMTDAGDWAVRVETTGCVSDESNVVTVQMEAQPSGTPFFEGIACENRNFKLNVTPVLTDAGYEWMDAAGNTYFGTNPEVPVQSNFSLKITSNSGCSATKQLPVQVNSTPAITALFDSGDANPCIVPESDDVTLMTEVFPTNDGNYSYNWTTPDGNQMAPMMDSMLIIPNTTANAVNGTYTLTVSTDAGCTSDPVSTIVEVTDVPVPNPVITASATDLCEGQSLTFTATEYDDFSATYRWQITSLADTVTTTPVLVLDSVTTAFSGAVSLQVFNGDCPSVGTVSLPIEVSTPLARPVITSDTVFCTGTTLTLRTTSIEGAMYMWEGPNFAATSSASEIVVTNAAGFENAGNYIVQVAANGCTSPISEPTNITINQMLAAPAVSNSGDICVDSGEDIILFIDDTNTLDGAEYRWFDASNDSLVAGPVTAKSQTIGAAKSPPGTYRFYATQTLNGCESMISNVTEVRLDDLPSEIAQVCEGNITICDVENAVICALPASEGIGTWTIDDETVTIDNPNQAETTVSGLRPGSTYTFFWRLSNSGCGEYSAARLIAEVGVTGAIANVCSPILEVCTGDAVNLCANPVPTGFTGRWSQPENQADLGVVIDNSAETNTTVSTIEAGTPFNTYVFYWTVIDAEGICTASDTMEVNLYGIPSNMAAIDDDELISCNGEAAIAANAVADGLTGTWSSPDENIMIDLPNSNTTGVSNLAAGMNTLIWSVSSGACNNFSSDEITIFFEEAPQAMDDIFDIGFSSSSVLNVVENDQIFSPEFEVTLFSNPSNGTATVQADGQIVYEANANFVGTDEFTYELCNPTCLSDCSTATVTLTVGQDAECIIPTIMTPNDDGVNDAFLIPCIETGNFPGNEVIIFNQWGDEIFRAAPYNNDWEGTFNGEDIPVGTYYYVISFDRNTEPKAGFIIIER